MSAIAPFAESAESRTSFSADNVEDITVLSPLQVAIYQDPDVSRQVGQLLWHLPEPVDPDAWELSWAFLVKRHPILRTVFRHTRQRAVQIILKRAAAASSVYEFDHLSSAARQEAMQDIIQQEAVRSFNLASGPLVRFCLFRLSDAVSTCLITFHRLILDEASIGMLQVQFADAYESTRQGATPALVAAPSFKTFLSWLGGQSVSDAGRFWQRYLSENAGPADVPLAPRIREMAGERLSRDFGLPEDLSKALREFSVSRNVRLESIFVAAWALLLSRYSGEFDVMFGFAVSSLPPDEPEIAQVLGPFTNNVPVRVRLRPDQSVSQFIDGFDQQSINLRHYSYLPLKDIAAKSSSPAPLFRSLLRFIDWTGVEQLSGVPFTNQKLNAQKGDLICDLSVEIVNARQLRIVFSSSQLTLDVAFAELAANYQHLLGSIAATPEARVCELEVMGEEGRERVKKLGRGGEAAEERIWAEQWIAVQARERGEALAVVSDDDGEALTYRELNQRANRLANYLRSEGVGREDRVGIMGPRSAGMLVAILGVLKAGAAYVPLHWAEPEERLLAMGGRAGLRWIAAGGEGVKRAGELGGRLGCKVLCWEKTRDEEKEEVEAAKEKAEGGVVKREQWEGSSDAEPVGVESSGKDLAYVFYTSGSTGVPKGVMVERRGMLNHLRAKIAVLGLGREDVVAQNASHCFDISVWQFMAALLVGGGVAIYGEERVLDPLGLVEGIGRDGVTVLEVVPSYLEMLLSVKGVEEKLGGKLKYLVSTAETLSEGLAERWWEQMGGVKLINAWGPTECSDDVTHAVMGGREQSGEGMRGERVSVGRAIAGSQVYVVDEEMNLLPAGARGEIVVGGVCVGRGYVGNGGTTGEKFVPDPFGEVAGGRLYLTGDVGRWRSDGQLEFLGRRDGQIKVRGHRLEVGEIEAALCRQAGVRQAAVELKKERLVGYWVGEEMGGAELRQGLSRRLPEYMIPEIFVRLEQLPLTRSGKLNRRALPEPDWKQAGAEHYLEPQTAVQRSLAQVWQEVLGVDRVGLHDDFFHLGGHSLNTIQVKSRISQRLKVEVPLKLIFENPRLESLACALSEMQSSPAPAPSLIPRLEDRQYYPLSHAQRRLWFLHQLDSEDRFYHTADCILLDGELNRDAFDKAIHGVIRRQAALRTSFTLLNSEPVQQIHAESVLTIPFYDLSSLDESIRSTETQSLLAKISDTAFDLCVPPVRGVLIKLAEKEHIFLLALHHIISDGWSGNVVSRDLMQLYANYSSGKEGELPALRIQYVDYAAWQNAHIESGALEQSEKYWLARLAGELPRLKLPVGVPTQIASGHEVREEAILIEAEPAGALRRLAQREEATAFMVGLALFKAFLMRLTGQEDILVGSNLAGRDRAELEEIVGLFVNIVAFRTSLAGNPSFIEVLRRVKQTCLEAYAHQEYPFDLLVQRLAPVRHAGEIPIFQTFFAEGPKETPANAAGVTFRAVDLGNETPVAAAGRKLPASFGMTTHESNDGSVTFRLLFRADVFDTATARRLGKQFKELLKEIVKHPEGRLPYLHTEIAAAQPEPSALPVSAGMYPLSFNQRDMWFQRQIHGEGGLNNVSARVLIAGELEVDRWRQALQSVVNLHDGLRTVFVEREGTPYQQVLTEVKVEFVQVDWGGESGEEEFSTSKAREQDREGEMRRRERELLSAAFDFQRGPLFRSELWRVGEREHIFVFAFHHLILDGVYMAELFEQVGAAYTALWEGKPAGGVELKMQYGDFAVGQEERLRQGRLEEHAAYWRRQLESPLPAMELPLDGEGRPTGSFELEVMERKIEREVWQGLRGMRKRYRTTVFRTVLAGLQVLLQRLTGEEELLLGVPFTTLPGAGVGLLGFFGHAVPVRARVEGRERFAEVLTAVNRQMREAEAHVEYPLCEAVKGMQINRDPHRPLFPVVISQIRRLHYSGGGLQLDMQGRQVQGGVYHLWLTVLEEQEGLTLAFFYNRELLAGKPIEQLADCMQHLLGSIAATPEARVCELEILTPAEKALVLDQYPAAATSNAESDRSLVTSIEERADEKPNAIAIVCEQDQLTYRELNQRANQMARWLRAQSIRPEDRVGILGSRGIGMLTTLLAVLKSGAAFVPLDPGLPDSRLQNILSRAELRMLATDQTLTERGVQLASSVTDAPQVISWAPDALVVPNPNTWADQSVDNLASVNHPRALAYVCFTSGSTGAPKGVIVEHKGLLNHLKAKIHVLNLDERDVVAQNASHSFDISVWQFFAALLVGGRVVVYPANSLALSGSLLPLVETDGVTILEVVPSLLELMLESAPAGIRLRKLRHLISNAETLPLALSRRWKEKFPHTSLINTYGATECSDDTTHYFVPDSNPTRRIAVGRSIAGARHYVVDRELRPLPSGFVGEIVIARDVVGRGYLQDPALTAAAFVPDPFAQDGSRIYLTGDFGRWNAAGDLEFLGRADHQIKLHGHRVELGDVESTLLRYPGVRHVAVMLRGQSGSQSLVAYWVGDSGVEASSLRRFSRSELPPHMVPGEFVKLPSMPLLSNGKIDRAMLPEPGDRALTDFVPARDEVEYQIAKIWQEELGVAEVGVFDNFFERGGHSLKAVSLIHKLQNAFSVNLPLRTIFDHQTIDALSQLIRSAAHDKPGSPAGNARLVALQAGDAAHLPLFLIHPHGGTVFCYQPLVNALGREIPVFGLQCRGLEDGEEPAESIPEMAGDYVSHIRLAQPHGPYQIAGWSFGGPVAYEVARQLECAGLEVRFLGIFDSAIPDDTHENLEYLRPLSERWEDFDLDMSVASFARWFFRIEEEGLEEVSESQALDRLRDMAQRRGMLPPDVSGEMLRRFMGVAIRNAIAFYQYRPESRVRTDVVLFRASQSLVEDPEVWQLWTEGRVHAITTSGTHYDMVFPPAVHVVAEALKQRLEVSRPIESRI